MALTDAVRARVFLSALGSIGREGLNADLAAIARTVRAKFSTDPPTNFLTYLNVVRQAYRAAQAGREVTNNPTTPLRNSQLPIVPATATNGQRYEYRIVIIADPGDGSEPFRTAVTVTSSTPLTQQQLTAIGEDMFRRQDFERDYRSRVDRLGAQPAIEVVTTAAGRVS